MKSARSRTAILAVSCLLLAAVSDTSAGKDDRSRCNVSTLKGSFGYTVTGSLAGGPTPGPFAAVGRLTFDGAGNFQNVRTISRNGTIAAQVQGVGTYSLGPECVGTLTFTDGGVVTLSTDIVVDADGDEFRMIATSPGTVLTVAGRRQFSNAGDR